MTKLKKKKIQNHGKPLRRFTNKMKSNQQIILKVAQSNSLINRVECSSRIQTDAQRDSTWKNSNTNDDWEIIDANMNYLLTSEYFSNVADWYLNNLVVWCFDRFTTLSLTSCSTYYIEQLYRQKSACLPACAIDQENFFYWSFFSEFLQKFFFFINSGKTFTPIASIFIIFLHDNAKL